MIFSHSFSNTKWWYYLDDAVILELFWTIKEPKNLRHHVRLVQKLKVIDIWLIVVEVVSNLPNYSCAVVLIYVYTKQSSKNVWGISIPWCDFMLCRYLINKNYLVFVYSVFKFFVNCSLISYDDRIQR